MRLFLPVLVIALRVALVFVHRCVAPRRGSCGSDLLVAPCAGQKPVATRCGGVFEMGSNNMKKFLTIKNKMELAFLGTGILLFLIVVGYTVYSIQFLVKKIDSATSEKINEAKTKTRFNVEDAKKLLEAIGQTTSTDPTGGGR